MRRKGVVASLIALALASSIFTGCGGSGASSQQSTTGGKPYEGVTLKMWMSSSELNKGTQELMDRATERFGIKFETEINPSGTEGDNILKTKLAAGEMPDLVNWNAGAKFFSLNPSQYFVDLTNEKMIEKVNDTFKKSVMVDGKVYGVPFTTTQAGAVVYWKPDYEELGLQVPKTWDQFLKNCEALKKANKTPIYLSNGDTWTTQVTFLGDYYNLKAAEPNFAKEFEAGNMKYATSRAGLEGFRKYEDLLSFYNADGSAAKYQDGVDDMGQGKATHWVILTQAIAEMIAKHPESKDKIGVFAIPGVSEETNGLTVWAPNSWYISKESQNKDAALAFLNFWLEEESINTFVENVGANGPSCIKGYTLPESVCPAVRVDMQKYFDDGKTTTALEYETAVKGNNCEQLTSALSLGQMKGQEAAERYDADCKLSATQLGLNWK